MTLAASEALIHRPCVGLWWQPGCFIPLTSKDPVSAGSQAAPSVDAQTVVLYVLFLSSICVSSAPVGCWKERHTEEWEMPCKEARSWEPRCLIISVSLGSTVGSKSAAINKLCKCRLILSTADGDLRILCLWEVKWQANWQEKQYSCSALAVRVLHCDTLPLWHEMTRGFREINDPVSLLRAEFHRLDPLWWKELQC